MNNKRRYRCAVYTRKSHEEGLDQEFNSLDAQREACEAYVLSQVGLGWELINKSYDDGGISGGHLERCGLQNLLADIKLGQVDVVVVYKVDRLTRSTTDFGKLVEIFDQHQASFVSVTQAFNTTNSMGRLTLNVLLSFAQFEREVTAERIRDKIASSEQKGMWMGGHVPFGYSNKDKKLIVDMEESKTVGTIFELYLEKKNVRLVKSALESIGVHSRRRVIKSGKITGGRSFSAGHIYSILKNPVYAGNIRHKEKIYPGNHISIIEQEKWDEVQAILANQKVARTQKSNTQSPALLAGLLFDDENNPLTPHHTTKNSKNYHYYVSRSPKPGALGPSGRKRSTRFPMQMIESLVKTVLVESLVDQSKILSSLQIEDLNVEAAQSVLSIAGELKDRISDSNPADLMEIYKEMIRKIVIGKGQIAIFINPTSLLQNTMPDKEQFQPIQLSKAISIKRRGQELKLVIGGQKTNQSNPDHSLIKLIAKAHTLKVELETGEVNSIKEFAVNHGMDHGDAKNLMPLCYLAPSIIEDILDGQQPSDLTASRLKSANNLPFNWNEQRPYLGFAT